MAFTNPYRWGSMSSGTVGNGPGATWFAKPRENDAFANRERAREQQRQQAISAASVGANGVPIGAAAAAASVDAANPALAMRGQRYTNLGPVANPDLDISHRGDLEKAYGQYGSQFFAPGAAQQFNQQHGAEFLAPTANEQLWQQQQAAGPLVNNAQREYNGFRKPNIAREPGYGSYYDNAQTNAVNALNTQLGARGAYGSSVGLGQIGKSITDLRADQARTEADYNLRRLAEQRNWSELGGTLARNADLSGRSNQDVMATLARNASDSRQAGLTGAQGAAEAAGRERMSGLIGGMTAAGASQTARENRVGMGLDALIKQAGGLSGLFGDAFDKLSADDQALLQAALTGQLGAAREKVNAESQHNVINQLGTVLKGIETAKGM